MSEHHDYDVIIIGAGISGLVCGCYLAKAGLKTLIVEKNAKPGGYCSSFNRNGFRFDACVHSLSSFRKGGRLNRIFEDLGLEGTVEINKNNPTDIIVTPEFKLKITTDIYETIAEFQKYFPNEKRQIERLFKFIAFTPVNIITQIRSKTLKELLNGYFADNFLKTILSTIILGLTGSPPDQISALVSCLIFREFILDGGYYPFGGTQVLADTLLQKFVELNGVALFSTSVKKINLKNNKVTGVELDNKDFKYSKYVVSACDVRQTFFKLISVNNASKNFSKKIVSLVPSLSAFLVYLGMGKDFNDNSDLKSTIWIIKSHNIKDIYSKLLNCNNIHLAITSPSTKDKKFKKKFGKTICLTTNVPYMNERYWNNNAFRNEFAEKLIKLSEEVIPGVTQYITLQFNATPLTLYIRTFNYNGAAYGWASTPSQFGNPDISQKTNIENLYLTGHWSNQSSGIVSVANCAYNAADIILRKI